MSDTEQRVAFLLERSEAGLVTASDTLAAAHVALREAKWREQNAKEYMVAAEAYYAEARRSVVVAQRNSKQAVRVRRTAFRLTMVALVLLIATVVL